MTKLFSAVLQAAPWTAVRVPGLFDAYTRHEAPLEARDYLGRSYQIGREERNLTVYTTLKL